MSKEKRELLKQIIDCSVRMTVYMRKMPKEQELKNNIPGEWIPQGTLRHSGISQPLSIDDMWEPINKDYE